MTYLFIEKKCLWLVLIYYARKKGRLELNLRLNYPKFHSFVCAQKKQLKLNVTILK